MKRGIENRFSLLGGLTPVEGTFVPVTDADLGVIESELSERLADDYRAFLQTYGAATFGDLVQFRLMQSSPVFISKDTPAPLIEVSPFSHFYGSDVGNQSLYKRIVLFRGRMPGTIVPIADDGGGNQICLGIQGDELGKVYYWDHENEWDEQDFFEDYGKSMPSEMKFQNIYLAANSFEDFIQRLERVKTG